MFAWPQHSIPCRSSPRLALQCNPRVPACLQRLRVCSACVPAAPARLQRLCACSACVPVVPAFLRCRCRLRGGCAKKHCGNLLLTFHFAGCSNNGLLSSRASYAVSLGKCSSYACCCRGKVVPFLGPECVSIFGAPGSDAAPCNFHVATFANTDVTCSTLKVAACAALQPAPDG